MRKTTRDVNVEVIYRQEVSISIQSGEGTGREHTIGRLIMNEEPQLSFIDPILLYRDSF